MNNKKQTYNAKDFVNYHEGKMNAQEMHALELAALEDPFLSDALDGYANTADHKNDIDYLQEKLLAKNNSSKVIALYPSLKNKWIRVAAAVVIFVGLGYLFFDLNKQNTENALAKKEVANTAPTTYDTTTLNNAAEADEVVTTENKSVLKEVNAAPKSFSDATIGNIDSATASRGQQLTIEQNANQYSNNNSSEKNYLTNKDANQNGFLNNTDDKSGGPKQRNFNRLNTNTQTQNNVQRFDALAKKERPKSFLDTVSYNDSKMATAEPAAAPVMKPNKDAHLEEVVISGYENKRKKEVTLSNGLDGRVSGIQTNSAKDKASVDYKIDANKETENETVVQFNEYIKKNIKPVFDDKGNIINGVVRLSFKTNGKGQPKKIKVIKSLSKSCDEQAIDLLKNGPRWTTTNELKFVDIIF
jgi:hypothetical protein